MAVKFLQPHTVGALYNEDEIAGFDEKTEADLIERKIAEPVKVKADKAATEKQAAEKAAADKAAAEQAAAEKAAAEAAAAEKAKA